MLLLLPPAAAPMLLPRSICCCCCLLSRKVFWIKRAGDMCMKSVSSAYLSFFAVAVAAVNAFTCVTCACRSFSFNFGCARTLAFVVVE
jgi:hypothetical protein